VRKVKWLCILIIISLCMCFVGCSDEKSKNSKVSSEDILDGENNENIANIFSESVTPSSLGSFYFGYDGISDNMQVYEYRGEEIHIPFKVTGMDEKANSEFGLIVFVDGILQPYRIKKKTGEESEEKFMQKFSLKNEESEEFDIVFIPVTGKEGDSSAVITSTILKPDFMPEDEKNPNYGGYHSISANTPQEICFKCDVMNETEKTGYLEFTMEDIPQEIRDEYEIFHDDGSDDILDTTCITELFQDDKKQVKFYAKDGKVKCKFRIYGGVEASYRTTIFVNHKPVPVMGADYIETKTVKGKICTVEFELEVGTSQKLNTIYAISVPCGRDYMITSNYPIKTSSALLIND